MPVSRRLISISKLGTNRKKALVGVQVRWLSSAIIVLQQLRFIKFHTRARGKSLDRLTVETSFMFGFAIFQALPVRIGLGIVSLSACLGQGHFIAQSFKLAFKILLPLLGYAFCQIFCAKFIVGYIVMKHVPH